MKNAVVFTGTIQQAIDAGLTFNGVKLTQPELSMLTRMGIGSFAKKVGTVARPKGTKGKPATIWEFYRNAELTFDIAGVGTVTTATVQAITTPPVVVLSDKIERIEPIKSRAELDDLIAGEADEYGDVPDFDADVRMDEDGTYRLTGPLRVAS